MQWSTTELLVNDIYVKLSLPLPFRVHSPIDLDKLFPMCIMFMINYLSFRDLYILVVSIIQIPASCIKVTTDAKWTYLPVESNLGYRTVKKFL